MLDPLVSQRFQAGDLEALREIIVTFQERLFRLGWRLFGNSTDGKDFAQNAFLHVYEQRHRFNPARPFEPWFYKVALNVGREMLRRRREIPSGDFLPEQTVAAEAEVRMENEERRQGVLKTLQSLGGKQREILSLRFESEMSLAQIAATLGIRLGTVKSRLSRGLEAFHKAYLQQGGDSNDL